MAAAQGDYVFFCDHDDWLAANALESLYRHAVEWGSDIVIPKTAGLRRRIPHQLFTRTRPQVSLATAPLMDSLTPHKLFRRAFLDEHQIRFPEGKRRLEDHYFVVNAYLNADVVSIAADQTYYYLLGRRDGGNSSTGAIDWEEHFRSLADAVEVVERNTDPGPFRDRLMRRWLQTEMCGRLSGRRYLSRSSEDVRKLFEQAHAVARDHFGPGMVSLMPPLMQPVGQAIIDGVRAIRTAVLSGLSSRVTIAYMGVTNPAHRQRRKRTVEAAGAQLFRKLGLEPSPDLNRRVLAVLTLLRA